MNIIERAEFYASEKQTGKSVNQIAEECHELPQVIRNHLMTLYCTNDEKQALSAGEMRLDEALELYRLRAKGKPITLEALRQTDNRGDFATCEVFDVRGQDPIRGWRIGTWDGMVCYWGIEEATPAWEKSHEPTLYVDYGNDVMEYHGQHVALARFGSYGIYRLVWQQLPKDHPARKTLEPWFSDYGEWGLN